MTEYNVFDVLEKKSKDHYSLLVGKKAQPPYIVHTLQRNFNFSSDQIKHFLFYLTVLPSNHTSRPFNTKFLPLYSTLTQNCTKSVLDRIICAVFARLSQKLLATFFITVHIPDISGLILSLTGICYPINGYTSVWKMFYME